MEWDEEYDYDEDDSGTLRVKFTLPRADKGPPPVAVTVPPEVIEAWARHYVEQWMDANLGKLVEKATMVILTKRLVGWIETKCEAGIEEQLEQFFLGEREMTDEHGFKKGRQEALGAAVLSYTQEHLSASIGDRYGRNKKKMRIEELVQELLIEPLGEDVKKMLAEVRKEQKEKAENFVAKMLAASMKELGTSR